LSRQGDHHQTSCAEQLAACGDGNFLSAILERKLAVVEKRYGKSQLDFERNAVLAVSSIYGIDILPDNVCDCRRRLFEVFEATYTRLSLLICGSTGFRPSADWGGACVWMC